MKRNINLYRPQRSGPADRLNARSVMLAWAAAAALTLAAQMWLDQRVATQARAISAIALEVAAAEEAVTARAAARIAGADPELAAELNAVMSELDLRETILGLLSGTESGDVAGFSAQLRSLARQHAEGVWLTRVEVRAPGARTTLEGTALSPEFVPVYLRRLSGEPALAGQRFDRFHIQRPEDEGEFVRFAMNRTLQAESN